MKSSKIDNYLNIILLNPHVQLVNSVFSTLSTSSLVIYFLPDFLQSV